jgi:hypothetical protein
MACTASTARIRAQDKANGLLVERYGSAFWVILFALGLYAARDLLPYRPDLRRLYLIKLIEVAALIAVRIGLRNPSYWPRVVPILVYGTISLYVMTAASAIVRHDVTSTPLAFTVVALGSPPFSRGVRERSSLPSWQPGWRSCGTSMRSAASPPTLSDIRRWP